MVGPRSLTYSVLIILLSQVKCVAASEAEFCAGAITFYHRCNNILGKGGYLDETSKK